MNRPLSFDIALEIDYSKKGMTFTFKSPPLADAVRLQQILNC